MNIKKKSKLLILAVLVVAMFFIGFASAIAVNTLDPQYLGFWGVEQKDSSLKVLKIDHFVLSSTRLRTVTQIQNPTTASVSFNATVSYYDSSGAELLNYTITDTLNAGQTKSYTNMNTLNVKAWVNTGINIQSTA